MSLPDPEDRPMRVSGGAAGINGLSDFDRTVAVMAERVGQLRMDKERLLALVGQLVHQIKCSDHPTNTLLVQHANEVVTDVTRDGR